MLGRGETEHRIQRSPKLVAHPREELTLGGVGVIGVLACLVQFRRLGAQLGVGVLQFAACLSCTSRVRFEVGLHGRYARAVGARGSTACHEFGDILDMMEDADDAAICGEDRTVGRAPESFLKGAVLTLGRDVVLLDGHRISDAISEHAIQRRPQVVHAGRIDGIGVVRKHLKQGATDNLLALRLCRRQVGIGRIDDLEVVTEDHARSGHGTEDVTEISLIGAGGHE